MQAKMKGVVWGRTAIVAAATLSALLLTYGAVSAANRQRASVPVTTIYRVKWGAEASLGTGQGQSGGTFSIRLGPASGTAHLLRLVGDVSMVPTHPEGSAALSEVLLTYWPASRGPTEAVTVSSMPATVPYAHQEVDSNPLSLILKTTGDRAQNMPLDLRFRHGGIPVPGGILNLTLASLQPTGGVIDFESQVAITYTASPAP